MPLTTRDIELLLGAYKCQMEESALKIDFEELAKLANYKSAESARQGFGIARRKISSGASYPTTSASPSPKSNAVEDAATQNDPTTLDGLRTAVDRQKRYLFPPQLRQKRAFDTPSPRPKRAKITHKARRSLQPPGPVNPPYKYVKLRTTRFESDEGGFVNPMAAEHKAQDRDAERVFNEWIDLEFLDG